MDSEDIDLWPLVLRYSMPAAHLNNELRSIEAQVGLRVVVAHDAGDDGRRVFARVFAEVEGPLAVKGKLNRFLFNVERTGDVGRAEALLREGFDLKFEAVHKG